MSRLVIGTAQFGLKYGIANKSGRVKPDEINNILLEAAKGGVNCLDTAIGYGDSERVLGEVGVSGWKVISKLPPLSEKCVDVVSWVEDQVFSSLDRLGVISLYAVLLHKPDQLLDPRGKDLRGALETLKARGLVKKIGISVYSPDELDRLFDQFCFDLVQAPMNILDRRFIESGWVKRLAALGVELHARSIFLQGLLLMPSSLRPKKFSYWQHLWSEWDLWLHKSGLSPVEACLRYALSIEGVNKVLVGVDDATQLREILLPAGVAPLRNTPEWPKQIDIELLNPSHWNQL